jgi:hypothetical protein
MIPSGMVFRREPHLPYNILFEIPSNREQPTTDDMTDFVEWVSYYYSRQHLNMASERTKVCYGPPSQLCRIPGRRPSLVVLSDLDQKKVA